MKKIIIIILLTSFAAFAQPPVKKNVIFMGPNKQLEAEIIVRDERNNPLYKYVLYQDYTWIKVSLKK